MSQQNVPLNERTCRVEMSDGEPCGRQVYLKRAPGDGDYVCVMYSHYFGKDKAAFEQEWQAIWNRTSIHNRIKNMRDFQGFVFPRVDLRMVCLAGAEVNFSKATFEHYADFSQSLFDRDVNFTNARFKKGASFELTRFQQRAIFAGTLFTADANFGWTSFAGEATFYLARFEAEAKFVRARFSEDAKFGEATFEGPAYFVFARFARDAGFARATFSRAAEFGFVDFSGIADFRWASFQNPTQAVFHRINNLEIRGDESPGLRLRLASCLLEGVRFEDVNWNLKNGRICIQDEADLREEPQGIARDTLEHGGLPPALTHELVADAYRRLVNNFEKSRQYDWAERCFLSEMEMRRCNPRHFLFANRALAKRLYANVGSARWLGENVSLTSFYRLLSNHGSSYGRALGVLAGFILLFAFLLPAFGLRMPSDSKVQAVCPWADPRSPESAIISWRCAFEHPQGGRQLIHTFDAGLWDALEVAAFQKSRTVEPANAGARRLEVIESIVVPGQLALLLLAIRRRFRR
jgi:uncharacterized protein YjbI with pentapeptide repeats